MYILYFVAHELRAWLLHYSSVVLHGILPQEYYQHHLLLVEGVYLLLKEEVTDGDIEQSSRLLKHYCFMFPFLYGTLKGGSKVYITIGHYSLGDTHLVCH